MIASKSAQISQLLMIDRKVYMRYNIANRNKEGLL